MASSFKDRRLLQLLTSPSTAWFVVWFPTVWYFVTTRLKHAGFNIGGGSAAARLGHLVTDTVQLLPDSVPFATTTTACQRLSEILYLQGNNKCDAASRTIPLSYGLYKVQSEDFRNGLVASVWRHDAEMGRGHLLLSEGLKGNGRIWRWEVGGGPIAIGKTLHLEAAGCRSNLKESCWTATDDATTATSSVGTGGIAIEFGKEHYSQGKLVVAEWGERRIVRMEAETGARTPLVLLEVPDVEEEHDVTAASSSTEPETEPVGAAARVAPLQQQPHQLMYTPFGDLIIVEKNAIYRLRQTAVHVPALSSLAASRRAHAWTKMEQRLQELNETSSEEGNKKKVKPVELPEILYSGSSQVGWVALTADWTSLYVTVKDGEDILLLSLSLQEDDEENKDDDEDAAVVQEKEPKIALNLSNLILGLTNVGPIAVDHTGLVYLGGGGGDGNNATIWIIDVAQAAVLGKLLALLPSLTSLTLGEDGFLYVTTQTSLMRIRVRNGPVKVPTNLVVVV